VLSIITWLSAMDILQSSGGHRPSLVVGCSITIEKKKKKNSPIRKIIKLTYHIPSGLSILCLGVWEYEMS
jgi:hypothetical protein